jgi:hypothetical protein
MLEHERGNFYALMTGLFELYNKKASPELLEIYFNALRAYELADLSRAANLHALDPDAGSFMPKPADFVRHIEGSKSTRALKAWTQVERAVRSIGNYPSVVFDDPITHAVIEDMGGWLEVCGCPDEHKFTFLGKEFEKRYQGYVLQGGVQEFPRVLVGLIEADCNRRNLPAPQPKLIGNPEKAKAVLLGGRIEPKRLSCDASEVLGNNVVRLMHKPGDVA